MMKETRDQSVSNKVAGKAAGERTEESKLSAGNASQIMKLARQTVVKTQIQHMRIKRMGQSLRDREADLSEEELRWTRRARAAARESEQKALDCLANRIRCRVRLTNIRERLLIHDALESELYTMWKEAESWFEKLVEGGDKLPEPALIIRALLTLTEKSGSGTSRNARELENHDLGLSETETVDATSRASSEDKASSDSFVNEGNEQ